MLPPIRRGLRRDHRTMAGSICRAGRPHAAGYKTRARQLQRHVGQRGPRLRSGLGRCGRLSRKLRQMEGGRRVSAGRRLSGRRGAGPARRRSRGAAGKTKRRPCSRHPERGAAQSATAAGVFLTEAGPPSGCEAAQLILDDEHSAVSGFREAAAVVARSHGFCSGGLFIAVLYSAISGAYGGAVGRGGFGRRGRRVAGRGCRAWWF